MQFRCSTCGALHSGFADLSFDAPYYYYTVPEGERALRCRLGSDLCSIDGADFFIRGCLEIPVVDRSESFVWGAWMSVSETNFRRYVEVYDEPLQSHVGPFVGWFSVRLPSYPDTLRLRVRAHLRDHGDRPSFELEPTDHPLAVEQREGITCARLRDLYETNLHPPGDGARAASQAPEE